MIVVLSLKFKSLNFIFGYDETLCKGDFYYRIGIVSSFPYNDELFRLLHMKWLYEEDIGSSDEIAMYINVWKNDIINKKDKEAEALNTMFQRTLHSLIQERSSL